MDAIDRYFVYILLLIAVLICFYIVYRRIKKARRYDLNKIHMKDIDKMDGFEFEDYLYVLLCALQYEKVYLTKKSGDYGADLVVINEFGDKIVIQAKRLTNKLSLSAVQEVYTAKAYYHAERAFIITTTDDISIPCRRLASATKTRIISRDELTTVLQLFKRGKYEKARELLENEHEPMPYESSMSYEVMKQESGYIKAGDYFYKI